ncbi:MAG: 4'-phosphopantetheinyl transferase superfamily protein [Myxococcota bacterium]|nr:4'-phosphopantetheinyl transferase superfamily protein [Deltaproteobacteria bacterium]MDQ3339504.1 4'-phosphopantetheinyl transferase superfamily protein [Myxococcota bacterium]
MIQKLETAHGLCVLVDIDDVEGTLAALPPEEQAHAQTLAEIRRREHVGGRFALHHALADFTTPIAISDRGAPVLPPGWTGSVSHKGTRAAAIVAAFGGAHVGLDLERAAPPKIDIARRILTPREQTALTGDALARGLAVTLRFAIKEAIYKAVDPYVRRYVGFTEVELDLEGDSCLVRSELPFAIEATWREHEGFWLATARATPR